MMLLEDSPAVLLLCLLCTETVYSFEKKNGESPSLNKDVKKSSQRSMCQLWQFQKSFEYLMTIRKRRGTDCKFQVPNHQETGHEKFFNSMSQARIPQTKHRATECNSKVSKHRETSRMECQSGFNLSKKASLVTFSCAELRAIWAAMHWRTRSQTRAHSRGLHRSDSSVASSATVERISAPKL